jgi:hypothetical protein
MITFLLRLYPARWRARYGDEFELILMDRPLGPFDVADTLLGALDAHLHLRGLGGASQHGRGFAMTPYIGGYAAILGGILWFAALAANAMTDGDGSSVSSWIGIVLVIATIATLIALVGLSAFQAHRYPALTWAAVAIPATGGIVGLLGTLAIAVSGDGDRQIIAGLTPWAIAMLGLVAMLAGSGLFALATWRTATLSRGAAGLLAVGSLAVIPGLFGLSAGLVPEGLAPVAFVGSVMLFPGGWVALGISALRARTADPPIHGLPFEPTRTTRLLGLVGVVGATLLLWAFVSFNPFVDPMVNGIRLVVFALAGAAVSLAFHRRQALAAPMLARVTTAAVVIAGVWYATWVIVSLGVDRPFVGTFGSVYFLANIALWVSAAVWAIGMLHTGAAWHGMPRRLGLITRLATWILVGSIVGWMGDDRLGLTDSRWGGMWQAIALAGVAMNGVGWGLLGAVLLFRGRTRSTWASVPRPARS